MDCGEPHNPRHWQFLGHGSPASACELSDLELLLGHELRSSTRYRRFACLVMVAEPNGPAELLELLGHTIRDSDEFLAWEESAVILMGETDTAGALAAIERYQGSCAGRSDPCFAVSCYPLDGRTASELISAAQSRLRKARLSGPGAVVAAD